MQGAGGGGAEGYFHYRQLLAISPSTNVCLMCYTCVLEEATKATNVWNKTSQRELENIETHV